jgi:chromatin structure-remodeling complex subunit RSC1/2
MNQYTTPQTQNPYQQNLVRPPQLGYKAPQPVEVYHLNDHANASIPPEIRQQFHCDEQGHVLFFTAPPIDPTGPPKEGAALGHSAKYLAAKAKREALLATKRKAEHVEKEHVTKRKKQEADEKFAEAVADLGARAVKALEMQLAAATKQDYQGLFNEDLHNGAEQSVERLLKMQEAQAQRNRAMQERKAKDAASVTVPIRGMTVALDEST